jgi:hypothetical protein
MHTLALLLVGLVLGCAGNATRKSPLYMNEDWQFFPCSMGDGEAFIYLNIGIADSISEAPKALARISLTYKSPRPNGLPTNEEFEPVKEIEDRIDAYSKEAGDWYVGRVTVAGQRHFYIYTTRDEGAWEDFVTNLNSESGYNMYLAIHDDPEHSGYHEDLYPTEDDWQVIKDLHVIENLESHGDDGSEPRKVDHWIYFGDKASSVDFVIWAESDRFTEEPEYSHETDDGEYCVRLFHHGTINIGDITSHTIALRRKAAEYGGHYDGWETSVLGSSDNNRMESDA